MLVLLAALSFAQPPAPRNLEPQQMVDGDRKALEAEFAPLHRELRALQEATAFYRPSASPEPDALPASLEWEVGRMLAPGVLRPDRLALTATAPPDPLALLAQPFGEGLSWSDYRVRFASGDSGPIAAIAYTRREETHNRIVSRTEHQILVTYGDHEIRVFAVGRSDRSPEPFVEQLVVLRLDDAGNITGATSRLLMNSGATIKNYVSSSS